MPGVCVDSWTVGVYCDARGVLLYWWFVTGVCGRGVVWGVWGVCCSAVLLYLRYDGHQLLLYGGIGWEYTCVGVGVVLFCITTGLGGMSCHCRAMLSRILWAFRPLIATMNLVHNSVASSFNIS